MSLDNFFRINLPYGIKRNNKNEWYAFNREYMPLGWNSTRFKAAFNSGNEYTDLPLYTKYKGLTEALLLKLASDSGAINRDEAGKIDSVWFYNDGTNPSSFPEHWNKYFDKIKLLAKLKV